MGKWQEVEIGEIVEKTNTENPKSSPDFEFSYIDISSIDREQTKIVEPKLLFGSEAPSRARKKVIPGDILFATTRPNLKNIAIVEDNSTKQIASTGFCVLRGNKTLIENRFLFNFLLTEEVQEQIEPLIRGAQYPAISDRDLKSVKIPLPPLPEQQRIVTKLDGLFAKIDQAIGLLEENIKHTQALMGSVLDEEFKKGKEQGWPELKFTEFAFLRHGHQFRKYDFVESGIPVVKIGQCKKDGSLDLSNCNYIDSSRLKEFQEDRIYKGDLLMALTGGTLGKVTWVENDYGDLVQNYRVGNFFNIEGKSIKRFLMYILMSSIFQKLVEAKVNQGAQPNIGKENIDNMLVPIPLVKKQKELVEKFDVTMKNQIKIIQLQTQKLNHLKSLKSSLLDQAFKGEL